jgi:tetratricopeptide (TPR) repeat protein
MRPKNSQIAFWLSLVVCPWLMTLLITSVRGAEPSFNVSDAVIAAVDAPLKNSGRVVGQVKQGDILHVAEVRGVWLLVESTRSKEKGWLRANQLNSRSQSEEAISKRLDTNPGDLEAVLTRGRLRLSRGDDDGARFDFQLLVASPTFRAEGHLWLARIETKKRVYVEAEKQLTEALKDAPEHVECLRERAEVYGKLAKFLERRRDLEKLVALEKATAEEYRQLAWEYSVHPDLVHRNGKKAVELAQKAIELNGFETPELLETLAAARAENGEFSEAVTVQRRVNSVEGRQAKSYEDEQRLKAYEKNTAIREAPAETWRKLEKTKE